MQWRGGVQGSEEYGEGVLGIGKIDIFSIRDLFITVKRVISHMKYNERNQIVNTVSVSRGILEHLGRKLNPYEFSVLMYLILRADFKTGCCITSSGDLATRIRLPQGTIRRILRTLSNNNYVKLFFESPNKTYPILVNRYHTEKGDVDAHGTESIQNIRYLSPHSVAEETSKGTNNTPPIRDDSALTETGKGTGGTANLNNPQVLPYDSNQELERSACNQPGHRLGIKEGHKQGHKSGDKQAPTESTESRYHGNKEGDRLGHRLGFNEGTLLKKIKEERKEEEKRKEEEREEGGFLDKSRNPTLSNKNSNTETGFFSHNGKWYKKSEFKVHDSGLLIDLRKDPLKDIPISFYDEPRKRVKREEIDLQKYFVFQGSAYANDKWVLNDEWLDAEPSVRLRKAMAG